MTDEVILINHHKSKVNHIHENEPAQNITILFLYVPVTPAQLAWQTYCTFVFVNMFTTTVGIKLVSFMF